MNTYVYCLIWENILIFISLSSRESLHKVNLVSSEITWTSTQKYREYVRSFVILEVTQRQMSELKLIIRR